VAASNTLSSLSFSLSLSFLFSFPVDDFDHSFFFDPCFSFKPSLSFFFPFPSLPFVFFASACAISFSFSNSAAQELRGSRGAGGRASGFSKAVCFDLLALEVADEGGRMSLLVDFLLCKYKFNRSAKVESQSVPLPSWTHRCLPHPRRPCASNYTLILGQ
jgi:hypothetical protein